MELLSTSFIYIKSFFKFFSSPLNNVSADILNDERSFYFSPEAEFISPLYFHIIFANDTEVESPCFAQMLQC